jgi:aromatic ring-cleaving dioxygenase
MLSNSLLTLIKSARQVFAKKFLYDIIKTFIGVFLAFYVSQWNSNRQSRFSEKTVLMEIKQDLVLDIADMEGNMGGHKNGKEASAYFWRALHGKPFGADSMRMEYSLLLRNFTSLQHSMAYESVKFKGIEIIKDDSLRMKIINLFDFELQGLKQMEEQYAPHDFFVLYYDKMNEKLQPHIKIAEDGKWLVATPFNQMPEKDKQIVKKWLQQLRMDRTFMIRSYEDAIMKAKDIQTEIDKYLGE